jgi:hypothetical protein
MSLGQITVYENNDTDLWLTLQEEVESSGTHATSYVNDASPVLSIGSTQTGETGSVTNVEHNGTTLEATTSAAHGRSPGETIVLSRVQGIEEANGTWLLGAGTTGSTLVLKTTADANIADPGGTYVSGGQWALGIDEATELEFDYVAASNGLYRSLLPGTAPMQAGTPYYGYLYDSGNYGPSKHTREFTFSVHRRGA